MPNPFRQLHDLAERCLTELASDELRPQKIWLSGDPDQLEAVKRAFLRVIESLEAGLARLAGVEDELFAGVPELDEWKAVELEAPEWKRKIGTLRPAANTRHVKEQLLSIRIRISELVEQLVVRSAVRDPYHRAANSMEAMRSVAFLFKEKELRETGLGLLEGITWEETLEGGVADWSMTFGPQHRIALEQFCDQLLENLKAIRELRRRSERVDRLAQLGERVGAQLDKIYRQLLEVPTNKVDAGIASDFHYMAGLAQKIVDAVTDRHGGIIADYAGRPLPSPVADLFRLLHLSVPRTPARVTASQLGPLTRADIERELGRRLAGGVQDVDPDDRGAGG